MKKDDIIGQKLFETCTLNQYYLNLISKATAEDDESPILLAAAYRQKLYAIVDRYDRMLESAKQREKLCLTLDQPSMSSKLSNLNQLKQHSVTASTTSLTRTSTPNKCFSSTSNTPAPTPTSYHQKYPAITPSQSTNSSFLKSSISNYTISSNHQKLTKTNSSSTLATISASNKNLSKSSNYNNNSNHSTNLNQTKLAQRLEAIYYYESSSSEDEVENDLDDVEDDIYNDVYYNSNNNNNNHNYNNLNSTTNQLALNLETSSKLLNRLNSKNTLPSDTSLLCSIKTITDTMSTRLDRLKTNLNDSTQSDYSNITNVTSLDHTNTMTPTVSMTSSSSTTTSSSSGGEKSSSNMSKDSGVFGDLTSDYYSSSSSTSKFIKSLVDQQSNNGELSTKNIDDNNTISKNGDLSSGYDDGSIANEDNNSTSPSSSSNSSSSSNDQDEEDEIEEEEYTESYEIDEYTITKAKSNTNTNNISQANRLVWSQMPNRNNEANQNKGARIVKGFTANQLRLNNNQNTNGPSLKEQFLQKKLIKQENGENINNNNLRNKYSTIVLNKSSTSHQNNTLYNKTTNNKLMNLELDLNDLDNANMMSMMMMNANNAMLIKNNNNNNENIISSSASSTPSPSSSTISSSSSSNNSHNETINQNDDSHLISTSPETTPNNLDDAKQSQFFFNSYNSLMNVSMLDNIQATNTNLEFDNMNTSILTFN